MEILLQKPFGYLSANILDEELDIEPSTFCILL